MTREEAIEHGKEQLEIFGGEHREFIELSIKALEQEPYEDAISRQAVLDLISKFIFEIHTEGGRDLNAHTNDVLRQILRYVGSDRVLPSVNPQEPKTDVLDKIRAEILDNAFSVVNPHNTYEYINVIDLDSIDEIIDKYKAESEDKE